MGRRRPETIVISSNGPLALKAIYCLRALGHRVHVASERDSLLLRRSRYVESFRRFDRVSFDSDILAWAEELQPALIMPVEVAAFATAHRLKHLNPRLPVFPCSSAELLDRLDNKAAFVDLAARYGVPVPRSTLIDGIDNIERRLAEIVGYPLMLKSLYGESSRGVARADSFADVERLLRLAPFQRLPVQAQSFHAGPVAGVNLLCVDGEIQAVATYRKRGFDTLSFEPIPGLDTAIAPLLLGVGFSGLANFDVILTPDQGALFLECNPRVWYNMQADCWMGLNFAEAGLAALHGRSTGAATARSGDYVFPMRLLKNLLQLNPIAWRASGASYRGLWQVLADPAAQAIRVS
jgi:biotin carboxylase